MKINSKQMSEAAANGFEVTVIINGEHYQYETKQATVWMIFPDGEHLYGTYDFTTDLEKCYVNELATRIAKERDCRTYVMEV